MTQKRSCSLTSGFIILAVVATLGAANAASPPRSSTTGANDTQLAQGQPVYNYYNYPAEPVERPGCYLPSDGCLGEYSVQN